MGKMYFTLVGCNHYYGTGFLEKGMKLTLKKEPDNEYDSEVIMVKAKAKVVYVLPNGAICKIVKDKKKENDKKELGGE